MCIAPYATSRSIRQNKLNSIMVEKIMLRGQKEKLEGKETVRKNAIASKFKFLTKPLWKRL